MANTQMDISSCRIVPPLLNMEQNPVTLPHIIQVNYSLTQASNTCENIEVADDLTLGSYQVTSNHIRIRTHQNACQCNAFSIQANLQMGLS